MNKISEVKYKGKKNITKKELGELYIDKKLSIRKIAQIFNCGPNLIWAKLYQFNIKVRTKSEANKGGYKIKIPEEIKSLYINDKLSISKIAKRFNCCCKSVSQRLHDYNITTGIRKIEIPQKELKDLYIKNKMTIYEIGEKFNVSGCTILNRLKYYNISRRTKSELNTGKYRVEIPIEKTKNLYIDKKMPISEIKKLFNCHHETLRKRLLRFGIPIRDISEALKGKPSTFKGKHHTLATKKKLSVLTVKQLASGKMKRQDTAIERKIGKGLKESQIYYQKHVPLCNITVADFYLPKYSLAIYADGDYWHNLPLVKNRDEKQNIILKQNGYRVLRFREYEINKSIDDCVRRIREQISSIN
jgi:very-short-patch-repair endonuclease/predicted DNA-binding protein YlxM (UPF0122 family)